MTAISFFAFDLASLMFVTYLACGSGLWCCGAINTRTDNALQLAKTGAAFALAVGWLTYRLFVQ